MRIWNLIISLVLSVALAGALVGWHAPAGAMTSSPFATLDQNNCDPGGKPLQTGGSHEDCVVGTGCVANAVLPAPIAQAIVVEESCAPYSVVKVTRSGRAIAPETRPPRLFV